MDEIGSGGAESFSFWLTGKLGLENEHVRTAATIASTYAILEIAENVIGVGSGFVKFDTTGLTLAQIKESIKRIEGKIDVLLETPLKLAKDRFRAAMNMIIHKDLKKAYETLNTVIDHATQAFYYMDSEDMTIKNFEACIQATQLLIFANIARFCYDEKSEAFLPFLNLTEEKKSMIATELMDIVNRCLENKNHVKKDFFSRSSEHKSKVQDTLDTILKVTYPFISEGKGWTKSTKKLTMEHNTVTFSVMPKFVPMGIKDRVALNLGLYTQENKYNKAEIWRAKDTVSICGYQRKILSESKLIKFSLNFINLTSSGGAAHYQGSSLGQYCYDLDTGCFIQTNTEKGHWEYKARYIYPVDDEWYINHTLGEKSGYLKNPTKSKSLPLVGWMYCTKPEDPWAADTTLEISPGPLISLCDSLTVSAWGLAALQSDCLGEFSRTNRWWLGKPVFRNRQGRLLHQSGKGWDVGPDLVLSCLQGSMTHHCPAKEENWTHYWDGKNDEPASVTIYCKVHGKSA